MPSTRRPRTANRRSDVAAFIGLEWRQLRTQFGWPSVLPQRGLTADFSRKMDKCAKPFDLKKRSRRGSAVSQILRGSPRQVSSCGAALESSPRRKPWEYELTSQSRGAAKEADLRNVLS